MRMKYRLIDKGKVVAEQVKDFDGNMEMNTHRIEDDMYGVEVDPLFLAKKGKNVSWVEGTEIKE